MNSLLHSLHSRFSVVTQRSPDEGWIRAFFQTLLSLFQFTENVKCRRISLELISWGPDSSLERGRLLHSCAVTAKKCSQKCDARANLLFCKSNAVVVAKALLSWKLRAPAYGLFQRSFQRWNTLDLGFIVLVRMMIAFRRGISFYKK